MFGPRNEDLEKRIAEQDVKVELDPTDLEIAKFAEEISTELVKHNMTLIEKHANQYADMIETLETREKELVDELLAREEDLRQVRAVTAAARAALDTITRKPPVQKGKAKINE